MVIHFKDEWAALKPEGGMTLALFWKVTMLTLEDYPFSLAIAVFSIVFSIFVLSLFGVHGLLVWKSLSTQEWLRGVFKGFPMSPYSYGGSCLNLSKIVCCPKRAQSRISHSLILRSEQSKPREIAAKKYEDHTMELGGPEFLPDQLYEASTELFTPLLLPDNDSLEFSEDENTPMNIMKHIGEG